MRCCFYVGVADTRVCNAHDEQAQLAELTRALAAERVAAEAKMEAAGEAAHLQAQLSSLEEARRQAEANLADKDAQQVGKRHAPSPPFHSSSTPP
jgi:hypothetical protein